MDKDALYYTYPHKERKDIYCICNAVIHRVYFLAHRVNSECKLFAFEQRQYRDATLISYNMLCILLWREAEQSAARELERERERKRVGQEKNLLLGQRSEKGPAPLFAVFATNDKKIASFVVRLMMCFVKIVRSLCACARATQTMIVAFAAIHFIFSILVVPLCLSSRDRLARIWCNLAH